jgi:hypothetical protein
VTLGGARIGASRLGRGEHPELRPHAFADLTVRLLRTVRPVDAAHPNRQRIQPSDTGILDFSSRNVDL